MSAHTCTYMHTSTCIYIHALTHIQIHAHLHIYTLTHMHTNTHAHADTEVPGSRDRSQCLESGWALLLDPKILPAVVRGRARRYASRPSDARTPRSGLLSQG